MKTKPSDLEDHLGYWLRCLSNLVHQAFATRLERYDVSVPQWVVLRSLHGRDPLSLNELAQTVGVDNGALSRMVERLSQKGLIRRETDASNRRAVRLSLTDSGRKLVPALASEADKNDASFFGVLTEKERLQLLATVHKLLSKNGWGVETHGKALN